MRILATFVAVIGFVTIADPDAIGQTSTDRVVGNQPLLRCSDQPM